MVREGFLVHNPTGQVDDSFFSTEAYLDGYEEAAKAADGIKDLRPNGIGYRNVAMTDGILLPDYRLPTEEWEYAALSLIGNSGEELITSRRTLGWTLRPERRQPRQILWRDQRQLVRSG